ncbi:LTA synthase family protein [Sulfurospirillum barnesii]|uniref:Phosphoglycerol transferase family protein, alkaline phosphatase superfamily n=1 Tax=Sulfurospirillum barnesii (strain ATCC 700032 / DSM 10660 / SES-3) TaxID=760154 RepID=I3XU02_SULBS|nr:LTA synthase family protein [Sulfurospirillum barnesii]AFL67426.1 phosphoglycerol transferase family protein, alkaline phosphatase superfamily [Sulfurospirillum barnesii SES-3]
MHFIKELFKTYFLFLVLLCMGRFLLYLSYNDRLHDISLGHSLLTFIYGVRMDTMVLSLLLVVPTLLLALLPDSVAIKITKFIKFYLLFWFIILIFIENATFPFFAQYDVRPNYLFVQYLDSPKEIISLLWKDYAKELLFSLVMMVIYGVWFMKSRFISIENTLKTPYIHRLLLLLPLLLLLFIGIRSSFGHRPANISDALYSTNRIINEITKNSLYSIGYAYYSNQKNSHEMIKEYGKINLDDAYALTSQLLDINVNDTKRPFYRSIKSNFKRENPKNLVIFIQESMGAQFVRFSGGEPNLTPNMNQLGEENIAFSNLYSNGTRSIRGLAALSSGFLPIPGEGVLKRSKSQNDFFTIATLLKPYGYKSSFIYGGEARFDNMRSWYLGNGFDEVIEEKDFKNPSFRSTWGVSDEDLVIKANEKFKTYARNNEKFVSVMFSQSNHAPFELPEGKIEFEPNEPKQSERNAIKYADYAIGKFFELAKKEAYYKDTVFVVVADHNVRVYGDDIVPVKTFQIPAIIVAEGIKPLNYHGLSSQPDVLATALDLVGLDFNYPILGHTIFNPIKPQIALMNFNDVYALRKEDEIAVIGPNMKMQTFKYENFKLIPKEPNPLLEKTTLGVIHVLHDLYEKRLYR